MSLVFALLLAACGEKESSGDADLDDWDGYVDEIKKTGIDEVIEVYQDAFDRYRN